MTRYLTRLVILALLALASPAAAQDSPKSNEDSKTQTPAEKPAIHAVGEVDNKMVGGLGGSQNIWTKVVVNKPNDLLRLRTTHPNPAAKKAFRQRIERHEEKLVACVKAELAGRTKDGFLSLELVAATDGSVSKSSVVKNELGDKVEACVGELLAPINYGKSSQKEKFVVFVQWKPNFKPRKSWAFGEAGAMGLKGTGSTRSGFGRIRGLGHAKADNTMPKAKRPGARVVPGQWSVEGGLEAPVVRRVIRTKRNALRYCYHRELQARPKLAGQLTLTVEINESGRVDSVTASESSLDDQKTESCLKRVHKRMVFPEPEGGSAKFSYQLDLSVR